MIRRRKDMEKNHYEQMRGGRLFVDAERLLEPSEAYGAGSFFGRASMPSGASIGVHRHTGEFEVYYILAGRARVFDNGEEAVLEPGDLMQCRDGGSHSIENIGDVPLEFLAMVLYNREGPKEEAPSF